MCTMTRVGLVGLGRIGARVAAHLGSRARISAVLLRSEKRHTDLPLTCSLDEFLSSQPDIVLEAASSDALAAYGPAIVRAGVDLLPLSLCALLTPKVERDLRDSIKAPGAGRVLIASGAVATLDALVTAKAAGLERVIYRTAKPLGVWRRTAAASLVDLRSIETATAILHGSVRDLAVHFPHNLNVAVGVALAGLGFERTEMELIADPTLTVTVHELEFWGKPGHFKMRLVGTDPDPVDDCADYTAYSVLHVLRTRSAPLIL